MSIQTELARIKGAKTDLQSWVEENGVTVPDGTLIDGLVELAKTVEAGGGDIRIEQGSVTFAENTYTYTFVSDIPDIFIAYIEDDTDPVYSSSNYIWALIQDTRMFELYGKQVKTMFIYGYNRGTRKYYTPSKSSCTKIGTFRSNDFNSSLGAKTYKYYAIYGVTAT